MAEATAMAAYQGHTVDQALSMAADVHRAQIAWRRTGFKERAPLMKNAAKVIRDNSLRYAKLMTDGQRSIDSCRL